MTRWIKKLVRSNIPGALIRTSVATSKPWLALTFDDGPCAGRTERVIDILRQRGHRATFFVMGCHAVRNPQALKQAVDAGCEIGNHTWNHRNANRQTWQELTSQIDRTNAAIAQATGIQGEVPWFRPPRGILAKSVFISLWRRRRRIAPILWSVKAQHPEHERTAQEIINAMRGVKAGDIVLLHDDSPAIAEALPGILDILQQRGLTSVTLSELIAGRVLSTKPAQQKSAAVPTAMARTAI